MDEELYQKFKTRLVSELRQEAPEILRVLAIAPELEVVIQREVVEASGKTVLGRVARLYANGFFDTYQTAVAAAKEVNATGASVDRRTVYDAVEKMLDMGYLYKNSNGYKAVPEKKIYVKEKP